MLRRFVGNAHLRRTLPMRMGLEEFFDSQRLNKKTKEDKIVAGTFIFFRRIRTLALVVSRKINGVVLHRSFVGCVGVKIKE